MATTAPSVVPYVELLGEPAVRLSSDRLSFKHDKRYFLLAFLAYQRDWEARERLARLFWPEHDRSDARLNLRQLLRRTRRLSWQPDLEVSGDLDDLRVRWRPHTDLERLERALASEDCETATNLYRGPLLAGLRVDADPEFAVWLDFERLQLQERMRKGILSHAAELEEARNHHKAATLLTALLRQDEFDEEVLQAYMKSSALAGQAKRALDAYDDFARRLEADMGLMPSTATAALAEHIRNGDLAFDAAAATAPDRFHRDGGVSSANPSRFGSSLPSPPQPLIGRELELSDLADQLAHAGCRLLTVTGMGGVGKSRLALQAATDLHLEYRDGAVFVPLEATPTGGSMAEAIGSALGLAPPPVGDMDPLGRLSNAFGDNHLLLVLDNVEHLGDAAEVISTLLDRCPQLKVLTKSRERLGLAEEWLLPLEGLAFPTLGIGLKEALSYDSVNLFVHRARRVRPAFYPSEEDLPFVIEICRLVDGLPLGIELAAAWLRLLPCEDVATEIRRDLDFLDRSDSNAAERQRSIRASFEHSWRRLEPAERSALQRLSVFRVEFDREAGMHVAGTRLAVLAALVDKSLLAARGDGRFGLHPLLRQYAGEKLAEDDLTLRRARAAHGRYFLHHLAKVSDYKGEARLAALSSLDRSFEDLAAAWRWARAKRPLDELARLSAALTSFCVNRTQYHEGLSLLSAALERPGSEPQDGPYTGQLFVQRARLLERLGRYEDAARDVRRGLELLGPTGDASAMLSGLSTLGKVAVRRGSYAEARQIFVDAFRRAEAHELREVHAQLAGSIGLAEQYLGRRMRAAAWYRRALKLHRELEDLPGVATSLMNLGNVLRLLDRPAPARRLLDEALALAEHIQSQDILPNLHINLGVLELSLNRPVLAVEKFETALQLARSSGNRNLQANANFQLGRVALAEGEAAASQDRFLESLRLSSEIGQNEKVIDCLVGLAWSRASLGDGERAERWLTAASEHAAASPGTKRWAGELRQAMESGLGSGNAVATEAAGTSVVSRLVEKALAQ